MLSAYQKKALSCLYGFIELESPVRSSTAFVYSEKPVAASASSNTLKVSADWTGERLAHLAYSLSYWPPVVSSPPCRVHAPRTTPDPTGPSTLSRRHSTTLPYLRTGNWMGTATSDSHPQHCDMRTAPSSTRATHIAPAHDVCRSRNRHSHTHTRTTPAKYSHICSDRLALNQPARAHINSQCKLRALARAARLGGLACTLGPAHSTRGHRPQWLPLAA